MVAVASLKAVSLMAWGIVLQLPDGSGGIGTGTDEISPPLNYAIF
jgi:hypothetical protein